MIGAPALVANAALRSGAGLVAVACPETIQTAVATLCPCATSIPLPEDAEGRIRPGASRRKLEDQGLLIPGSAPTVVAMGPGLGTGDARFGRGLCSLADAFRRGAGVPVVLDADGLNAMRRTKSASGGRGWETESHLHTIITPHPGEMARLHGISTTKVQADHEGIAVRTARMMAGSVAQASGLSSADRPVVVLKGYRTIVTDGIRVFVNRTGNAGMATGGSGDVLTGIIAGLVAQGMLRWDAAVLGVHLHGLAGDSAARALGQHGLVATDLIDYLPGSIKQVAGRR